MKIAKLLLSATVALAYLEEYEVQYAPAPFFDDSQVDQAYVEQQFQSEEDPEFATFEEEEEEYEEEPSEFEEEPSEDALYEEEPDQAYTEISEQDQDFEDSETHEDEEYELGDEEDYENEGEQDFEPTYQAAKGPAAKKAARSQTAAKSQNTSTRRRGNPVLFFSIIGGFVGLVIVGAIVYRVVKKRNESKEQSAPLMI
jgi:hypothetical protein